MKHSGRHIHLIVAAISAALLGMLSLQGYLLWSAYQTKQQAFDRNVMNALSAVSQQLEKDEAGEKIFTAAMQISPAPKGTSVLHMRHTDTLSEHDGPQYSWIMKDSCPPGSQQMLKIAMVRSSAADTPQAYSVTSDRGRGSKGSSGYAYTMDENRITIRATMGDSASLLIDDSTKQKKDEIVSRVVERLFMVERLPLQKRVTVTRLDSLVRRSLDAVGISIPYRFTVSGEANATILSSFADTAEKAVEGTPFSIRLFPNDLISPRYELRLDLPEKRSAVLSEIGGLSLLSLLFSATIIISFIYTVRTIYRQRRLASSVIDFINNMTHEFKTPISTIALASEAIARPDVMKSKKKILKYNSVIGDENIRMKQQVEKILQMAVLEEGETEFKVEQVDLHDLIARAVHTISVQIDQRNGSVVQELKAEASTVNGDRLHLSNVLSTILDNAIKYSPAHPAIRIETESSASRFVLRIRDRGIGMSKQDLSRVFDKYYRVSTGNTHDVKGFGLGLSYVKLIVDAHRGSIVLESTPGAGTTVEITLPLTFS